MVVIVHSNQKTHALATVTWDNAFSEPVREPFAVTNEVPWFRVAEVLGMMFKSATGRALTPENLRFLEEKAFENSDHAPNQEYYNQILTWSAFAKENMHDRNFTFWEWFNSMLKLTKKHLTKPWSRGGIHGFLSRSQAEKMLDSKPSGTFLIIFSEFDLGAVSVAWVEGSP